MYIVDRISVTERHLNDILQQRHLNGTIATVKQHYEATMNRRQLHHV